MTAVATRTTAGPKTLGQALKTMAPTLFPPAGDSALATVIMHGAPLPLDAPLADLMMEAAYPDGWLNLVVYLP